LVETIKKLQRLSKGKKPARFLIDRRIGAGEVLYDKFTP